MAKDSRFIRPNSFNLKFKNYLRDFYIYQFKKNDSDFREKGQRYVKDANGDYLLDSYGHIVREEDVNKKVLPATFSTDSRRLNLALGQAAGVLWKKGECITIDARQLETNPFFALYRCCYEGATDSGSHLALLYGLLLYFNIGNGVQRVYEKFSLEETAEFDGFMKALSAALYNEKHDTLYNFNTDSIKRAVWDDLTFKQKDRYAKKAIGLYNRGKQDKIFEVIYYFGADDVSKREALIKKVKKSRLLENFYGYAVQNRLETVFEDGAFGFKENRDRYVEKKVLYDALKCYTDVEGKELTLKQFGNKMSELERIGILCRKETGKKIYYALSCLFVKDILGDNTDFALRFADMVSFFSQTSSLGEIGAFILDRIPPHKNNIYHKHNYIKRALNDFNIIDLLYAIKNGLWAYIEYRNAGTNDMKYQKILCYPIEIRESVTDGRQYLIYYHAGYRSVSALRIEFIDSIQLVKTESNASLNSDLERAKFLIKHTWGTAFSDFSKGNVTGDIPLNTVRLVIKYNQDEDYIVNRLQRETRRLAEYKKIVHSVHGNCIEFKVCLVNTDEMVQWARSYTKRIVLFEINGQPFEEYNNYIKAAYRLYNSRLGLVEYTAKAQPTEKVILNDRIDGFDCESTEGLHGLLFNELYGISFDRLGELLLSITKQVESQVDLRSAVDGYVESFVSDQSTDKVNRDTQRLRAKQAEGFIKPFFYETDGKAVPKFNLEISSIRDIIPLTAIEIQWINNILKNPLAKCFLSPAEIDRLLKALPDQGLFDINSIVLYDQFTNPPRRDLFYEYVGVIASAIRDCKAVKLTYNTRHNGQKTYICEPSHLEYSKRDNKFRVYAVTKPHGVSAFNLERIETVELTDKSFDSERVKSLVDGYVKANRRTLEILFSEQRGIPDRVLTEFSPWEKKCAKRSKDKYKMLLTFDANDYKEILIRLLSYGPYVYLTDSSDFDVRDELIHRLEEQLELSADLQNLISLEVEER